MDSIETKRLLLRPIRAEDAQQIYDCWASDPAVTRFLTWEPHASVADTGKIVAVWLQEYEKPDCYRYGLELKATGALIGTIDVVGYHHGNPVIGYASGRAYWNNGYMTEALAAFRDRLLADGHDTLVIEAVAENTGSNRVIEKCGFTFVGSYQQALSPAKPEPVTVNSYRLWRNGPPADLQFRP
jgi:ribosomal-protein-alanine N-acetyltransferase